jgi:hypothetical protein
MKDLLTLGRLGGLGNTTSYITLVSWGCEWSTETSITKDIRMSIVYLVGKKSII